MVSKKVARVTEERLAKYRALKVPTPIDGIKDPGVKAFIERATEEGMDVVGESYSPLNTFFRAPYATDLGDLDVAFIGSPHDITAPFHSGTKLGPDYVRRWSRSYTAVHNRWFTCPFDLVKAADIGDIDFNSYSAAQHAQTTRELFDQIFKNDIVPITIGGAHTMTLPILQALGQDKDRPLSVVHLDAHSDSNAGSFYGENINDGNIFSETVFDGSIDPERVVQIGIRGRVGAFWDFAHDVGFRVISAEEFQERGTQHVMDEVREIISDTPTYLSIDSDAISATHMPGTTLAEPFGLTDRETRDIVRGLRGCDIIGADLMEINPLLDPSGISGNLGAALLLEIFCVVAEARVDRTGTKRKTHWK